MKNVWNCLSDPGLHLLALALLMIYMALGPGEKRPPRAESPLVSCGLCHSHHYIDSGCNLRVAREVARSRP